MSLRHIVVLGLLVLALGASRPGHPSAETVSSIQPGAAVEACCDDCAGHESQDPCDEGCGHCPCCGGLSPLLAGFQPASSLSFRIEPLQEGAVLLLAPGDPRILVPPPRLRV